MSKARAIRRPDNREDPDIRPMSGAPGKSLWVNSTLADAVFKYSLPNLTLIGHCALPLVHPLGRAPTGGVPEWIAFTPDSKFVYISNSAARSVSAVDVQTLQEVAQIPVGEVPKRINTLVLP